MKPRIVLSGSYRASDQDREWRIVEKQQGIGIEVEERKDAMGKTVFSLVKKFETAGVEFVVVRTLLAMWASKQRLPDVEAPGELLHGKLEKGEWRIVKSVKEGVVVEQVTRLDLLNEQVWSRVDAFDCQCSVERHIFCKLLEMLKTA